MKDYILDVLFDVRDAALDEVVQARLFLTSSTGSSSVEMSGTITVSAYFDSEHERDEAAVVLRDLEGVEVHATERERIDWLVHYQQSLEPLYIGEGFVVAPDARLIPRGTTRHTLVVPQEQAFGTGSHETTSLCIEILETLDVAGKRGLDVGAGSGILALAMCRLGAAQVIALDNDVDAFPALRENRLRNGVGPAQMSLFIGSLDALRGGRFDIVTMNIVPDVIVSLLPGMKQHVGGSLVLSGILIVKRGEVVRACTDQGLVLAAERSKGEWWAGVFHCL